MILRAVAFLLLLSLPASAADAKKAKAYLKEVKKHLLESYVDRAKLTDEQLTRAGLQAMEKADDRTREAVRSARTLEAAIDEAAKVVDDGFDFFKLADPAAHAMVKETGDPFSKVLTSEEFNKLLKMMQGGGREESPGMSVSAATGQVAYVQYGTPAYEEGIEIGDTILEVAGQSIRGCSQEQVNEMFKLPEAGPLPVKIQRQGHSAPYVFHLARRKAVKDVRFEYFGEGIGYLRLTIFDLKLSSEVKKALEELRKLGMKKLILDLRHNPGGALPAATAVADLFLPQGLIITTTESSYKPNLFGFEIPGQGGDQEFKTKVKSDFEQMPLVVLVNHASASASELLSGALQDHKRGKLIGETTYGKGVGQAPIFLQSVMQERYLYLTVMTYKLPTGRSIHHKGVVPDVEFADSRPAPAKFAALWALRSSGRLDRFVSERWPKDASLLRRLAKNDGFEWARYPGFDALYSSLGTTLSKDDVRSELRRAIRRHLERTEDVLWVSDLETDLQLQRALVEFLD